MAGLVPIFAAASIAATVVWLIVRMFNRRPFAIGAIALLPMLAISVLFSDLRGEFLATLNRVFPWLLVSGGTMALVCSALVYQSYVSWVTRFFHSNRFRRWTVLACGPRWVEKIQSEWKKWEVVTPARKRINICGSLVFIAAGAVWMALR
jgi:hypothetical protein